MQSDQYKRIVKTLLQIVDSPMYQHFVSLLDQKGNVPFSGARMVAKVCDGLQFCPDFGSHVVLVEVIETHSLAASSEN